MGRIPPEEGWPGRSGPGNRAPPDWAEPEPTGISRLRRDRLRHRRDAGLRAASGLRSTLRWPLAEVASLLLSRTLEGWQDVPGVAVVAQVHLPADDLVADLHSQDEVPFLVRRSEPPRSVAECVQF